MVALLFAETGSVVLLSTETVAVLERVAFLIVGTTVMVTVADPPMVRLPSEQLTVPVEPTGGAVQLPWLALKLTNPLPDGSVSVSEPAVAFGPRFCTLIVRM